MFSAPNTPTTGTRALLVTAALFSITGSAFGQNEAESLSSSFRKAARRVLPAVVTVRPASAAIGVPGQIVPNLPPPLDAIVPRVTIEGPAFAREPGGSGVVIDSHKGFILTNEHVIRPGGRLVVVLPDGRERPVQEVRRDPRSDLALLVVDPEDLQAAEWGDSDSLDTGDWVLAIGQPFGLPGTVTAGIVSAKGRAGGPGLFNEDLIQTDAAINPGNSGGPLVNLKGEVVGINLALRTHNGSFEGLGFAIPASRARRVAVDLAEVGRVRRAFVGIEVAPAGPEVVGHPGAVRVTKVMGGSPADLAGLRPGDWIVAVEGQPVRGVGPLIAALEFANVNEPLHLTVARDNQERELAVRPRLRAEDAAAAPGPVEPPPPQPEPAPAPRQGELGARNPTRYPELGLRVDEMSPALHRRFGIQPATEGLVVVGVEPDGPADRGGLEVGMVITDVSNQRVMDLASFRAAVSGRARGTGLVVRVLRNGRPGFRVILDEGANPNPALPPPRSDRPPIQSEPQELEPLPDLKPPKP